MKVEIICNIPAWVGWLVLFALFLDVLIKKLDGKN